MKSSKMLSLLVATTMGAIISASTENPNILHIEEDAVVEISSNDNSDDENILHKLISHYGDKNFKIRVQLDVTPYVTETLLSDDLLKLDDQYEEELKNNLKILLFSKNKDGKTPRQLLKDKKTVMNNNSYKFMNKLMKHVEQSIIEEDNKQNNTVALVSVVALQDEKQNN